MIKLKYIALHLTYVCENRCSYCYIGDGKRNAHPSFSKVARIIKKLAANGVKEVLLVGGNPCAYPDLKKVIGLIKKLDLKVFILSNTLAFGEDFKFFLNNVDSFHYIKIIAVKFLRLLKI